MRNMLCFLVLILALAGGTGCHTTTYYGQETDFSNAHPELTKEPAYFNHKVGDGFQQDIGTDGN